jgi:hypothetical protein
MRRRRVSTTFHPCSFAHARGSPADAGSESPAGSPSDATASASSSRPPASNFFGATREPPRHPRRHSQRGSIIQRVAAQHPETTPVPQPAQDRNSRCSIPWERGAPFERPTGPAGTDRTPLPPSPPRCRRQAEGQGSRRAVNLWLTEGQASRSTLLRGVRPPPLVLSLELRLALGRKSFAVNVLPLMVVMSVPVIRGSAGRGSGPWSWPWAPGPTPGGHRGPARACSPDRRARGVSAPKVLT